MAEGWLYDGETALRHEVAVEAAVGGLLIRRRHDPGGGETVAANQLLHAGNRGGFEVFGRRDLPGWRVGIPADALAGLAGALPAAERYGRWIDRIGLGRAVLAGVAISAALIFAGMRFPALAAPYVPASWEKRFGDALVGDFGGRYCAGPGGQAALDKLAARLSPHARDLRVRVAQVPIVNAAALPGGHIVIFDELLKQADGPDELAGVLAHEIAHIDEHHVTQAMIRELGLGVFIAGLGGQTGANIESLLSARYSRGAESEADDDAVAALRRAGISPLPTAGFFQRMAKQEDDLGRVAEPLSYLSTHPLSGERRRKFRAAFDKARAYTPSLSRDEWEALFNICFNDPRKAEKKIQFLAG